LVTFAFAGLQGMCEVFTVVTNSEVLHLSGRTLTISSFEQWSVLQSSWEAAG
jgi:hypothetical protein